MQASSKYVGEHCQIAPIAMQLVPIYKELLKIRRLAGELTVFGGANNDDVVAAELEATRAKAQEAASKSTADFAFQIRKAQATITSNDGSIHGTAGPDDLPLFLIKAEAEYLNYLSLIVRFVLLLFLHSPHTFAGFLWGDDGVRRSICTCIVQRGPS